jgi:hypothetical protein
MGLLVAASYAPLMARAGLGGSATSILDDGTAMGAASMTTTPMPSYVRHEITTADGVRVREFAAQDGKVFAVAFDGPTMPDLKTVLGTHYDSYVAAATQRRGSHHVVSFASDGAVVTIMKTPRGFSGQAQLPSSTPQGIQAQDLR